MNRFQDQVFGLIIVTKIQKEGLTHGKGIMRWEYNLL